MKGASILLPTYNERDNISDIVREILVNVPEVGILIIDDNSPDGTGDVADRLSKKYPQVRVLHRAKKEGLGEAYKEGIRLVLEDPSTKRVITMDADGSHSPEYLAPILAREADIVIGSRYCHGGAIINWETWRYVLSRGGNLYARSLTGLPIGDFTSGFMSLNAGLLRRMDLYHINASGYAFLIEMKYCMIHTLRGSVEELPIIFRERRGGESKISNHIISEGLKTPLRLLGDRILRCRV